MARIKLDKACVAFAVKLPPNATVDTGSAPTGGRIDLATSMVKALDYITIDIAPGSRIGLIGHNGAGKSTLLRLMAGVYEPVSGEAEISGRIATLFNATPGLNLDSTGRENVITCGLFLGLSRREINARADDIVAFADLGGYIDLPVRTYSAGMVMRLGFAIATSLDPDILLIDEGLGTGDAAFAAKAEKRMRDLADRASILVIASHSTNLLASFCSIGVVLRQGRIVATGPIQSVLEDYHASVAKAASEGDLDARRAAYTIATELATSGQDLPLALEQQALAEALTIKPGDLGMLRRYRQLFELQGLPVEPALELQIQTAALRLTPQDNTIAAKIVEISAANGLEPDEDIKAIINQRLVEMTGAGRRQRHPRQ